MNSYVEVTVILGTILNGSVWLTSAWLCPASGPPEKNSDIVPTGAAGCLSVLV